ncbi:MAG TPA: tetratricopeptide repeat protein [Methylotenera sp.]|nr:tetratricopeptide repeat protein [Methylotenera sp.]
MSLLIKALDNLDKNKQAEKDSSTTADAPVTSVLSLELEAIEPLDTTPNTAGNEKIEAGNKLNAKETLDSGLSLEDEAGLIAGTRRAHKPAKPRQGTAIATALEKSVSQGSRANEARDQVKQAQILQDVNLAKTDNVSFNETNVKATEQDNSTKNKAAAFDNAASEIKKSTQHAEAAQATLISQKVAAKAFVANTSIKTPASKSTLILLAVAGLVMIWLGLQGFNYIKALFVPEAIIVKPAALTQPEVIVTNPNEGAKPAELTLLTDSQAQDPQENKQNSKQNSQAQTPELTQSTLPLNQNSANSNTNTFMTEGETPKTRSSKKANNNADESFDDDSSLQASTTRAPIKLITQAPSSGIDPTLLAAYQAFIRGDDVVAQRQYRQVLQNDVRNVDALLGMAAIAQRQGRDADAMGWYQKVLEIEPRNSIAQSAIVASQANADVVGTESRIKNMLALQPDVANLHAALGNLYAEQNQWPLAQEAYFNASRFAPNNADYAFNLAISLDQLGKSTLALKQYQRALELLNKSGASSPDRAQLEARIQALQ